jgi:toxin-antitoxin system PIN domain toxin
MQMPDVNVLVYAHRRDAVEHVRFAKWLDALVTGPEPFALSEAVLHGFVRVVTYSKIFQPASTVEQAFRFLDGILELPNCTLIRPGPEHLGIFRSLCENHHAKGKLVADAAHAALAIESGCEWVSADTDFARFAPPLRWTHL